MKQIDKKRNILYICLQSLHLMVYCVLVNYAGTVLQGKGYSSTQIGVILSLGNLAGFLLQVFAASISDRVKKVKPSFIMGTGFAILAVLIVCIARIDRRCMAYSLLYILAIGFISMQIPLIYAYAEFLHRMQTVIYFSVARGAASICFAVMSTAVGELYSGNRLMSIYMLTLGILAGIFGVLYAFSKDEGNCVPEKQDSGGIGEKVGLRDLAVNYKPFCYYLIGAFLIFCGTNFLQNFMIQAVEMLGGDSAQMGMIFSLGAVTEIVFFFGYPWIRKRVSAKLLIKIALAFYTLQGILLLFAESTVMLFFAYLAQAPGVGILLPAATDYIAETMQYSYINRAQALSNGVNLLSRIVSACLGGVLLGLLDIHGMFVIQTAMGLAGLLIVLKGLR